VAVGVALVDKDACNAARAWTRVREKRVVKSKAVKEEEKSKDAKTRDKPELRYL
jgi:hypothetical protein